MRTWPELGAVAAETLTVVVADFKPRACVTVGADHVPPRSVDGFCHVAEVAVVAIRACPVVGAVAAEVFTLPDADLRAADVVTVGFGYVPPSSPPAEPVGLVLGFCQVAVVLDVAVSTWPFRGAVAAEVLTLVVADLIAAEVATDGLGYVPLRSPPAVPLGDELELGVCQIAVVELVAVST